MRVAICTTPLSSGHKNRGIGIYTTLLLDALHRYQKGCHYSVFADKKEIPKDTQVVHYPFFDPFFLTLPVSLPFPLVVTVHDLIPVLFPEHFPRGIRGEVKWQIQKRALQRTAHILTDSEHSKKDIASIGYPKDRISVVPLAPVPSMKPETDPDVLVQVMEKYGLPHEFILYVGDVNWNKNVLGLLLAWQDIVSHRKLTPETKLVLVGKAFTDPNIPEAKEIDAMIKTLALEGAVIRTGFVPENDLRVLYMLSGCTVVPSLYEGFGFPVLEALACGGIVVSSAVSSLSEIAGPSIRIDPHNARDISRGIVEASRLHVKERECLAEEGIAWAKQYSWKKVAQKTMIVYEHVAVKKQ